ncbi:MAG: ABC transporter permease [Bacteroidota bacterium]
MNDIQTPKGGRALLTWFCSEEWLDELLGDLEEEYTDNIERTGKRKATIRYYQQVLMLIRPHIIKKRKPSPLMLRNYLKSSYRSLIKNKAYSIINVLGLTVGITCCLLISLYVQDEMSYDNFFEDNDRIYRVALERVYPTNTRYFGSSPVNLAPTLLENYPEVEEAGRLHRLFFQNEIEVTIGENRFIEDKYLFADNDFFNVFSFEFVEGDASSALEGVNDVVITESTAKRFFGEGTALNKVYNIDTTSFLVSGVIKDVPSNSHMAFDILGSIHSLPFLEQAASSNSWINPWLFTYIKLEEGVNPKTLEDKLPEMVRTYGMASILSQLSISEEEYPSSGNEFNYFLQPAKDIHLKSNLDVEIQANSNINYVYLLIAVVFFILIISCINFINMATARSAERAKEVGVRKVLGSHKSMLVKQFLTEANLVALIAFLLAIVATMAVLPSFNTLVGKQLGLEAISNPIILTGLIVVILFIGTLAGIYPALVISSIKSALVLKGKYSTSSKGIWLRNSLIVFQFFISIAMISGMLLLNKQMTFMQNKQLGFNKENVIVVDQAQEVGTDQQAFKNELLAMEGIKNVSYGFAMPGEFTGNFIATSEIPDLPIVRTFAVSIDDNYIPTLGMEMISGRGFEPSYNDSLNVIINETAASLLGYDEAVGRKVINPNPGQNQSRELTIIGVVKDYHHQSLHTEIPPMILFNIPDRAIMPRMAIKVETNDMLTLIQNIESKWKEFESERPISYAFLDKNLDELYEADLKTGTVFSLFTMITIIMACIGLFGLAAYVTEQRTKEIGVRKVLGASIGNIIILLSLNFTKLILISFGLAIPLVYFGMDKWMESFAYRTSVDIVTLIASGLLTLILAWITISYYSIKIAVLNPVKSLRSE